MTDATLPPDRRDAVLVRVAAHYGVSLAQLRTIGSGPHAAASARSVAQAVLAALGERPYRQTAYFDQNAKSIAQAVRRVAEDGPRANARDAILRALGEHRLAAPAHPRAVYVPFTGDAAAYAYVWQAVAEHYGLPVAELRSKSRERSRVQARQMLMALLADILRNIAAVARMMDLDHSTVLHSMQRVHAKPAEEAIYQYLRGTLPAAVHQGAPPRDPLPTLTMALAALDARQAAAVRAYILVDLIGNPAHTSTALTRYGGLAALATRPDLVRVVTRILHYHGEVGAAGLLGKALAGQARVAG